VRLEVRVARLQIEEHGGTSGATGKSSAAAGPSDFGVQFPQWNEAWPQPAAARPFRLDRQADFRFPFRAAAHDY
jgi:hypothetical protein